MPDLRALAEVDPAGQDSAKQRLVERVAGVNLAPGGGPGLGVEPGGIQFPHQGNEGAELGEALEDPANPVRFLGVDDQFDFITTDFRRAFARHDRDAR